MESWTTQRARVAALKRHRSCDDPDVASAEADLAVTRLEDHVRKVVDSFPSLTDAQRNRLAALLRPTA